MSCKSCCPYSLNILPAQQVAEIDIAYWEREQGGEMKSFELEVEDGEPPLHIILSSIEKS